MILTGNTLGERQQDLNKKVNDAVSKKLPLEEIKEEEKSDVDKLFKIDLASKYKNVKYIIETLKSGDDLFVSRAMKCLWLYEDEQSDFINPDYLQNNVFAFMSSKMKKKFLTTIAANVRNEARAAEFYQYCKTNRLYRFAFKFLISTSLEFRSQFLESNFSTLEEKMIDDSSDIVFLIKDSFTLAEMYLKHVPDYRRLNIWYTLRSLYSVDPERYLNTMESYFKNDESSLGRHIGLRFSKDIMKKHKNRLQEHIHLYLPIINKSTFCKHTTAEEAKRYLVNLLPDEASSFWSVCYRRKYDFVLDLIASEDKYEFIKNIFHAKYPESEFEMSSEFYDQTYYEFMSVDERESWALRHLANPNKSFLSDGCTDREYVWYGFVNFDQAMKGIKKYVLITPDAHDRADIVNILLQSVRIQDELEKLFKYYFERHVNEDRCIKETFIREVIEHNTVWELNENCWASLNKLLHSIELYNPMDDHFNNYTHKYTCIPVLFYHLIHKLELPEGLKKLHSDLEFYLVQANVKKINKEEQRQIIYQFLKQFYIDKIKSLCDSDGKLLKNNKWQCMEYVSQMKWLLNHFNETDENFPETVLKYMRSVEPVKDELSQSKIMRMLKQDSQLLLKEDNYPNIYLTKIDTFLRKLKLYFSYDLAPYFLKQVTQALSEKDTDYQKLFSAVHCIFLLADETFKTEFMMKYVPTDPKIKHGEIDRILLYIQEAICRFACYSRPPVPLEVVRLYIKGDYVRFCLPMFYMYGAKLQPQPCIQFVEVLLDAPVSIQKHGLRLAFHCFSFENLKTLVLKIWKKTKNISLRQVIYTYLYEDIFKREDTEQSELFKLFLTLTSQLNEEDHDDVLNILTGCIKLPEHLRNEFLETAWKIVNKFPGDNKNIKRRASVIENIANNIDSVDKTVVLSIVNDYLNDIFTNKHIIPTKDRAKFDELNKYKLQLTVSFIAKCDDEEHIKYGLELVHMILSNCFAMWQDSSAFNNQTTYFSRSYCYQFINDLENEHFNLGKDNNTAMNVIFETIIKHLLDALPMHEVYLIVWKLRISIITNNTLGNQRQEVNNANMWMKKNTKTFAIEVAKLIKEFVDRQKFTLSLLQDVSEIVRHFLGLLIRSVQLPDYSKCLVDARILVSKELMHSKMPEVILLAISILPIEPSQNFLEDHKQIVQTIKEIDNFEVQALFYQKIVRGKFVKVSG